MQTKENTQIIVEMTLSKSTKGTHVFTASQEGAAVTTLYVSKTALGEKPPSQISLTITPTA